jgi:exoribonuclease R
MAAMEEQARRAGEHEFERDRVAEVQRAENLARHSREREEGYVLGVASNIIGGLLAKGIDASMDQAAELAVILARKLIAKVRE